MATNTDIKEYPTKRIEGEVLKTATIKGEAGKQIKIESTSLQLYSGKDKVINNTVVAINGEPWAAWNWNVGKYSDALTYSRCQHLVEAGKDAVITWTVKTSDAKYTAKFKNASYTYSYVDVATPEPEYPATERKNPFVVIECTTSAKAEAAAADIKAKGIVTDDMKIYIAKSV